ncbi:MAG: alpha/beta hydrolase [Flavobacteriaceae bacterium]|nr:alpha/beta hydrolase [Flavobacteriaceae bacterium]
MKKKRMIFGLLMLLIAVIILYLIPASQTDFFQQYTKNDSYSSSLRIIRNTPLKTIEVDGVTWNYFMDGKGKKTILFIHGMGGTYDLWWNQLSYFKNDYTVISFTLPVSVNSLEKSKKGILKILEKEGVNRFHLVGTSMGGYIAQYMVYSVPERIEKVVLSNTFPPNSLLKKENAGKRKFLPFLPEIILFKLSEKQLKNVILPTSKNSKLLEAMLLNLPFSKKQLVGRFDVVVDSFYVSPSNLKINTIPKLIIESDNDPLVPPILREEIKKLYPNAKIYTFHNEGHFPYVTDAQNYSKIIDAFLNESN